MRCTIYTMNYKTKESLKASLISNLWFQRSQFKDWRSRLLNTIYPPPPPHTHTSTLLQCGITLSSIKQYKERIIKCYEFIALVLIKSEEYYSISLFVCKYKFWYCKIKAITLMMKTLESLALMVKTNQTIVNLTRNRISPCAAHNNTNILII